MAEFCGRIDDAFFLQLSEEDAEMPDDWQPLEPLKAEMPRMELNLQPGQTGHDLPFDKAHHADYEAIRHIRDNCLKKKQINSYLEQQHHEHSQRGWLAYDHVGVDRSLLTEAFREPADASRACIEMLCRRADDADAEASTCGARCGGECKGAVSYTHLTLPTKA